MPGRGSLASTLMIFWYISRSLSDVNGSSPVSSAYMITPQAHMSTAGV